MKLKLTSEDISCIIPCLNKLLDGCYLTQIYDGNEDNTRSVVFKLRYKSEEIVKYYYLLIETGIRLHTIDNFVSVRPAPSGLVSKLRKEFKDKRLWPIKQIGNDRSIDIKFSNSNHLIIELYDKGNFILTDENYIITYIIRSYQYKDKKIDVKYKYPIEELIIDSKMIDISNSKGYIVKNEVFSGFPIENKDVMEFEDINEALKFYFKTEEKKVKVTKKEKQKTRQNNKKGNIESQIDKLTKSEEKEIEKADKFIENISLYQEIIDIIKLFLQNSRSFDILNDELKLRYNNSIKIDHEKLIIDEYILDYNISAYENVNKIYNKKKVFTNKKEKALNLYENTKFEKKTNETKNKIIINRKQHKFEDFWWFIIDNIKILCGKSADDNEKLLNNCEKNDVLIHGHFDKSPWAIVKNPDKIEIPIKILNYAGNFLVQRSWSWNENYPNDSYYTYPDKISKSAPSGEFMGKGSRMVHEKNILSTADMIMALTVIFYTKDGKFTLNPDRYNEIEYGMVMCCPYNVANSALFKIKLKPSGTKRDKGRKKLLESIISNFMKVKLKDNRIKDYVRAIPKDEWDKVCIHYFNLK